MRPIAVLGALLATLATAAAAEEKIGYPSVADALIAVQKDMNAETAMQDGWTVAQTTEGGKSVIWTFTQKGHPAHPTAVKRTFTAKDGAWQIDMKVLCEAASKAACDKLIEEFRQLNEEMRKNARGGG